MRENKKKKEFSFQRILCTISGVCSALSQTTLLLQFIILSTAIIVSDYATLLHFHHVDLLTFTFIQCKLFEVNYINFGCSIDINS